MHIRARHVLFLVCLLVCLVAGVFLAPVVQSADPKIAYRTIVAEQLQLDAKFRANIAENQRYHERYLFLEGQKQLLEKQTPGLAAKMKVEAKGKQ